MLKRAAVSVPAFNVSVTTRKLSATINKIRRASALECQHQASSCELIARNMRTSRNNSCESLATSKPHSSSLHCPLWVIRVVLAGFRNVCSTPVTSAKADIAKGPRSANGRHHSITSSAEASTCGGISSPKVLAVLRLMTSSNLIARKTGISAGLSPLSTRPV